MRRWYEDRIMEAGDNAFYCGEEKVVKYLERHLTERDGYISVPVDGAYGYAIGSSEGKYGEYARIGGTCFSVNKGGYVFAKAGTEKGDKLVAALKGLIAAMRRQNGEDVEAVEEEKAWAYRVVDRTNARIRAVTSAVLDRINDAWDRANGYGNHH